MASSSTNRKYPLLCGFTRLVKRLLKKGAWTTVVFYQTFKRWKSRRLARAKRIICRHDYQAEGVGVHVVCKSVHYFLANQLAIQSSHEVLSLIKDQAMRFSLYEFEDITGLNCDPYDTQEQWDMACNLNCFCLFSGGCNLVGFWFSGWMYFRWFLLVFGWMYFGCLTLMVSYIMLILARLFQLHSAHYKF